MSIEENTAIVRRAYEALNEQDLDSLDDLFAPDLVDGAKRATAWLNDTFTGHKVSITDMIAEGDKVWVRIATSGTHSGEWQGIPATGKEIAGTGARFFRLSEGKIVKVEALHDRLGQLLQLGATIAPPE
jgi:predicted ester cyclase